MKAVIMAGGKGTRLRPLTCDRPKPMVPILNKPMMEHILVLLNKHGMNDVLVTLQYMPEVIREYFADGRNWNMHMRYFIEDQPLGTAGSVKNAQSYLDGTFLVISGDAMTDIDLTDAVRFHKEKRAKATIILTRVQNPLEYGMVITDQEGRIRRFLEKPGWGEVFSDMVNTGIYILEADMLDYFESGRNFDFSKDLFPMMLKNNDPMYGYAAKGYWCDVGNLDTYRQTHYDILTGKVDIPISTKQKAPRIWIEEGADIHVTAKLSSPVYIGAQCRIGENAEVSEFSVLGEQILISANSSIKRSVVWDNVFIGKDTEIRGATVCSGSSIKDRCAVFEGAVIGADTTIGNKSIIKPNVKIWPDKTVAAGTTLNSSLIWGATSQNRLFGTLGISGSFNVDITSEFAAKLGTSYGSGIAKGHAVVFGSDSSKAAQAIKRAISAGVLLSGHNVYDIGTCTTPICRFAVMRLDANGAVYVRQTPYEQNGILIEFMDSKGMNLDRNTERKIERDYFGEDFIRVLPGDTGRISFVPDISHHYLSSILKSADVDAIRKRHIRIVIDNGVSELSMLIYELVNTLGCDVISPDNMKYNRAGTIQYTGDKPLENIARISETVTYAEADLGISIDSNGEHLLLVDDAGNTLSKDNFIALLSLMILKKKPSSTVVVPVTAPHVIEKMAERYKGNVVRSKANPRSLMETIVRENVFAGDNGMPQFQPVFDGMVALVRVLEFLAQEGSALSKIMVDIPRYYMDEETVKCPWERKGEVMRSLIEDGMDNRLELLDGVKVFHDAGWALILPDSDEPVVHVYSEAASMEDAVDLKRLYVSKIEGLNGENQN